MLFRSKKDPWLQALLLATVAITWAGALVVPLVLVMDPPDPAALGRLRAFDEILGAVVSAVLMAILGSLVLWFERITRYEVGERSLLVVSGPMHREVPLSSIDEVVPVRSALAAPALSVDRLEVRWRSMGDVEDVMISPADRDAFLDAVAAAAPHLAREGDALVRR